MVARAIGVVDDDRLRGVRMNDGVVPRDALFVPPRFVPNNRLIVDHGRHRPHQRPGRVGRRQRRRPARPGHHRRRCRFRSRHLNLALGGWLGMLPPVLRTFVLATIAVPIVIYGLMPHLHKLRVRILRRLAVR